MNDIIELLHCMEHVVTQSMGLDDYQNPMSWKDHMETKILEEEDRLRHEVEQDRLEKEMAQRKEEEERQKRREEIKSKLKIAKEQREKVELERIQRKKELRLEELRI